MTEQIYWLWLSSVTEAVPNAKGALLRAFSSPKEAFQAPPGAFRTLEGVSKKAADLFEKRDLRRAEAIAERCQKENVSILTMDDDRYPADLKKLYAPPAVIYAGGNLSALERQPAVAVIGTRKASPYGIKMARNISYELVRCGAALVTGMTAGAELAAVDGALAAEGRVIGVLGTPVNDARGKREKDVMEGGLLLSEYPPDTVPVRSFFRAKNRIAAALSAAVVVVEAPEKSGTRFFVEDALELGREIFAVPGNADSENSLGTLRMLQEGAGMVTHGWEVAAELSSAYPQLNVENRESFPTFSSSKDRQKKPSKFSKQPFEGKSGNKKIVDKKNDGGYIDISELKPKLTEEEYQILCAVSACAHSAEEIADQTGLPIPTVLPKLTLLEIRGFLKRESGVGFQINNSK